METLYASEQTLLAEEVTIRPKVEATKRELDHAQEAGLPIDELDVILMVAVNNTLKFYANRDKLRDMLQA